MEVDYEKTNVESFKEFLIEIGEDPSDYTEKQLLHMLQAGV